MRRQSPPQASLLFFLYVAPLRFVKKAIAKTPQCDRSILPLWFVKKGDRITYFIINTFSLDSS
ncbi:MAG: hypothetical protein V7K31_05845 [Nostoc sp.]